MVPSSASACSLKVGWEEWKPYIFEETGRITDPEYRHLMTYAEKADCQIEWVYAPWARALKLLANEELDLLYAAGKTAEREGYAQFSQPYRTEAIWLAISDTGDDPTVDEISLEDWLTKMVILEGASRLGVIRGSYYGEAVSDIKSKFDVPLLYEVSDDLQLIDMLRRNRISGYLIEAGLADYHQDKTAETLRFYRLIEQTGDPLHYMFSKGVEIEIINRFNAAISQNHNTPM